MLRTRVKTVATSLLATSLFTVSCLQPFVFAQRRAAPVNRERSFRAIVHGDLKETYISDRHKDDQNDHSEQELTVNYDIDKDVRYDDTEGLVEFPGRKASAGGSFHATVDTTTSDRDLHEHYKMDTAGAILDGSIDFLHGTREQRIDVSNSDGVPQSCKSEGNITRATDDCGVVSLSDISFHDYGKGKVVSISQAVDAKTTSERPQDLTADLDYVGNEWYGSIVQGAITSGFTVTLQAKKLLNPPVTDDGYKITQQKTIDLVIKVSPSGKIAWLVQRSLFADPYSADLTAVLDPRSSRLDGRPDRSDR